MSEIFKHIGAGQFPSSSEYNRLVDSVMGLLRSSNVQYFSDSTGVHVRRMPSTAAAVQLQLFQITVVGSWGNYTCKKYTIDNTHWTGSSGQTKLVKINDDTYTVFNIAEDATTTSNSLDVGDVLLARQEVDDEGNNRLIGFSPKYAWWDV